MAIFISKHLTPFDGIPDAGNGHLKFQATSVGDKPNSLEHQ